MQFELFDYQAEAASSVTKHLARALRNYAEDPTEQAAVILAAPTGAGKTVIATAVVEALLDEPEKVGSERASTFLWVTDDPSLNRQTLHKMMAASSSLAPNRLVTIENDFDAEVFEPGKVYFLNIQKLSAKASLSKSRVDGRSYSLWETIANTITQQPCDFSVVVDEAHRGMGATSSVRRARDTIVSQIIGGGSTGRPAVPVVWGISATPRKFVTAMTDLGRTVKTHSIRVDDVRASGLLKDQIVLGHTAGVDAAESTLVRHAVRRVREYEQNWASYTDSSDEPHVHPALVIQVADKPTEKELADLIGTVLDEWPEVHHGNIVHVFGEHADLKIGESRISWCPPEDIQDRSEVRVVLCKTAITTGWDCPRAEVLVSLRVAKDIDLITQVMGRMVRTPLARRIQSAEDLNAVHCILPKFDQSAVDAIAAKFRAGDDDTLTGGTQIVTEPVQLARNPQLELTKLQTEPKTVSADGPASPAHENFMKLAADDGSERSEGRPAPANWSDQPEDQDSVSNVEDEGLFAEAEPVQQLSSSGPSNVFDLVASLPSYTIPRRALRSPVTRLTSLALLLANTGIEEQAPTKARNQLLAVLETMRADLVEAGKMEEAIQRARSTRLYERSVFLGQDAKEAVDTDTIIQLDARGIRILMDRARAVLPEGLANAYVNRIATTDDDVLEAMITTIALAGEPTLRSEIDIRASQLVEDWFNRYGSAITRQPAVEQERFDRIKRESDRPLPTTITIPTRRIDDATGQVWERHLISDDAGLFRVVLRDWEEHVLRTELDAGAEAWYRNPQSGRHSLQIPYTTSQGIAGLAPDFIFVHQVGGELVASLIDPHGTHLADAVPKLKGLATYAAKHSSRYHRIQSVAKIGTVYRMLNHRDKEVREAILAAETQDAADLFRSHGTDY
ncbi:DEAD/DEAH box helicase [Streptomyces sp. ME02-6978.2a]|uniref:DEAD/DEAH box helicase n=1 Tax=Streptomyces sp. ME02-6978.2a TaxID=462922 RepID=UPI0029A72B33|nr:DEAD/DEAH box helicase family protein [Streptomyces sp. ME02-6978.2a]MDX3362725.1 DEAD/DEAH box helicase family protein [Streptomyces sp. ME02-6978.2a]